MKKVNSIGWFLSTHTRERHSMSNLYRPVKLVPRHEQKPEPSSKNQSKKSDSESLSKSLKLMVDNGLIRSSLSSGAFHLLPLALKSMEKLIRMVDDFMGQADCQKIQMPTLTSVSLWQLTGRIEECGSELMTIKNRHNREYVLSPTHEEAVCELLSNQQLSQRQFPLRLYQITNKFRDEMKPRFGLMRSREFLMKDLYTFDIDEQSAQRTYAEINAVYGKLLDFIGVSWIKAAGDSGFIGGIMSHEFNLLSSVGEDRLQICKDCNEAQNESMATFTCSNCGSKNIYKSNAIEVGHTFLLGTKYSYPLGAVYLKEGAEAISLEMGCYGLGLSRLLAAIVEVLSKPEEIRWPHRLAPYLICIVPPKAGSKEEPFGKKLADQQYSVLNGILPNDVLVDDRTEYTIGKRIIDAKKLGIPYLIVFGRTVKEIVPIVEVHDTNRETVTTMPVKDVGNFFYDVKDQLKNIT